MLHPLEIYNEATREVTEEFVDYPLSQLSGTLPRALRGVLYRNGPGRLAHHGYRYDHLFDGDGMVQRFLFADGEVRYTNRYVRTLEFAQEAAAGKPLYRSFGTNLPGGLLRNAFRMHFKNSANTHVLLNNGRLFALWEGGAPHELDPVTLETRGRATFGSVLEPKHAGERAMGVGRPFAAHYRLDRGSGDTLSFGLSPGLKQRLLLHRLTAEGELQEPSELDLPHLSFVHDFVLTEEGDRIFFLVPVSFGVAASFAGLSTPVGSIVSRDEPTTVLITRGEEVTHTLESDSCYLFHFVNGYREGASFVVDLCRMDAFPSAADVRALLRNRVPENPMFGLFTRYRLDSESGAVRREELFDHPMELPTVNPERQGRPYRYAWSIAGDPERPTAEGTIHGVAKFDLQGAAAIYKSFYPDFPGEPLFVQNPESSAEDGGWILMLLFNVREERTELLVLDAPTLQETWRAALPVPIHIGFHGVWSRDSRYLRRPDSVDGSP